MANATYYATGHRKNAIARVWLAPGEGEILVNDKQALDYLGRSALVVHLRQPLEAVGLAGQLNVRAKCRGGGLSGQAGAVRHGIAHALLRYNPELRPVLRRAGLLTRDSRIKERKKYGRKRARRGFQFSKR
jgi:small subunit ribosomal protein S9